MYYTLLFGMGSLSILLASGSLYRFSHLANSLLLLFCLLSVATTTFSRLDRKAFPKRYYWPIVTLFLLFLFCQLQAETKPFLAEACVLAILTLILSLPTFSIEERNVRLMIVLASSTFLALSLLFETSSAAWFLVEWYARRVSHYLGSLFGLPLRLGPTAMGLSGLGLCIVYTWTRVLPSFRQQWKRSVAVTLSLICVNHVGAIFLGWLASVITQSKTAGMSWDLVAEKGYTALDFIPILFILECLILYALLDRSLTADEKLRASFESRKRHVIAKYGIPWFLLVMTAYVITQWPAGSYDGYVVLYQGGLTSWEKPNFEQLGSANRPGLFCVLPDYLETFGFQVELTKDISTSVLEKADVIVLMNFNETWEKERYAVLNDYVRKGGALMVFADHTDMSGLMKQTNLLLASTPIRVNFDSAHFLDNYWHSAFVTRLHSANRQNWDKDGVGISVGASLRLLNPKASPILLARYGFSDKGNRNNTGSKNYLGDRMYNTDEALGDIVLAAEYEMEAGKIIVFGDTALLQMGALPYSHRYVADLFKWAIHGKLLGLPWGLILFLAMGLLWWTARLREGSVIRVTTFALAISLAVIAGEWLLRLSYGNHQHRGRIAYLDQAHVSACDHQGYAKDDGDTYLIDNLVRNDFIPMAWNRFHGIALKKSVLMISMAATKAYSDHETKAVDAFMKSGGQLLLLSSDRCRHATKDLTAQYGIEILSTPLGAISPDKNSEKILMYNANPLSVEALEKEEVRCAAHGDYPVVVEREVGEGRLTMIADYGLFFNGRLEKRDWASPANILFLKKLIGNAHVGQESSARPKS